MTFAGDRDVTQQVCVNNLVNVVFLRPHDRKYWLMQIHFSFSNSDDLFKLQMSIFEI